MRGQIPDDARLEIKFVAYETEMPELMRWLRLHPARFDVPYPPRRVNNIYFDGHEYFAYAESLSGASNRTKVRYRWYGQHDYPVDGAMEIKCKRNRFSWKQKFPITLPLSTGGESWRLVRRMMLDQVPSDCTRWMDTYPLPVIINRYYRHYYVTGDGRVRATIDSRQVVFDQRYKPLPNVRHPMPDPGTMVMELKFDRGEQAYAAQILQGLPLRVSRHSKYMMGVQSVYGY